MTCLQSAPSADLHANRSLLERLVASTGAECSVAVLSWLLLDLGLPGACCTGCQWALKIAHSQGAPREARGTPAPTEGATGAGPRVRVSAAARRCSHGHGWNQPRCRASSGPGSNDGMGRGTTPAGRLCGSGIKPARATAETGLNPDRPARRQLGLHGAERLKAPADGGRGGGIRTPDFLLPKQARYQTAPRPASLYSRAAGSPPGRPAR